jgi:hypothetical protein
MKMREKRGQKKARGCIRGLNPMFGERIGGDSSTIALKMVQCNTVELLYSSLVDGKKTVFHAAPHRIQALLRRARVNVLPEP